MKKSAQELKAIDFAKSILVNEQENKHISREYCLLVHKSREELQYYCKQNNISLKYVFREARKAYKGQLGA